MPASDEPSSPDVSCRTCKSPEFKPVLISERFGVETFFCPECEQTWENLRKESPSPIRVAQTFRRSAVFQHSNPAYASGVSPSGPY
jgi:hypothetical protein